MDGLSHLEQLEKELNPTRFGALDNQKEAVDQTLHVIPAQKSSYGLAESVRGMNRQKMVEVPNIKVAETPSRSQREYFAPQTLSEYLRKIQTPGRKFAVLNFDLDEAHSEDEVRRIIERSPTLLSDEKEKALSLLGNQKTESVVIDSEEPKKPEVVKEVAKETPKTVESKEVILDKLAGSRKEYAKQISLYVQAVKSKQAQYSKLLGEFGVDKKLPVMDLPEELLEAEDEYFAWRQKAKVGEDVLFDTRESEELRSTVTAESSPRTREIIRKSVENWKNVSIAADIKMLENLLVDEDHKPEPVKDAAPTPASIPVPKKVMMDVRPPQPKVQPEAVRKPVEAVKTPESTENLVSYPIGFKNRKLEVVGSVVAGKKVARLILDGVEIASGEVTPSGIKAKLNPKFESNLLLSETDESSAFKKAKPVMQSLQF